MGKEQFSQDKLRAFLKSTKVATLDDLKDALGTTGTMTVFRKLKALGYLSSYSHRGKFYTLQDIPEFDEQGLWGWHSVWFSHYGNLIETARELVEESAGGVSATELEAILHVECKHALLKLLQQDRVARDRIGRVYVYLAKDATRQRHQRLQRREHADDLMASQVQVMSHELQAAIILFSSLLDEKQRRLYAGLEAQKFGHGGDRKVADLLGLDVHTVARGRRELFGGQVDPERVRRKGGGRKAVEKKPRKSSKRYGS